MPSWTEAPLYKTLATQTQSSLPGRVRGRQVRSLNHMGMDARMVGGCPWLSNALLCKAQEGYERGSTCWSLEKAAGKTFNMDHTKGQGASKGVLVHPNNQSDSGKSHHFSLIPWDWHLFHQDLRTLRTLTAVLLPKPSNKCPPLVTATM